MLVLSRRPGQSLVFSRPRIVVSVQSVQGKTVRLAIEAPRHVQVHRDELVMRQESQSGPAALPACEPSLAVPPATSATNHVSLATGLDIEAGG